MKLIKLITLVLSITIIGLTTSSCSIKLPESPIKHFDDWIKTSDEGFLYYYNEYNSKGVYILDIPSADTLTIPEYIDGKKVVELGHDDEALTYKTGYSIDGKHISRLIIQHNFDVAGGRNSKNYVDFPNLKELVYVDFLYCYLDYVETELIIPYYIGKKTTNIPNVELRKSERKYTLNNSTVKVIIIPEYVKIIEEGVFDGLKDVVIKTSYESKPDGWEEGWNGACIVEWGTDIK